MLVAILVGVLSTNRYLELITPPVIKLRSSKFMIFGGSRGGSDTVRHVEFKSAVKIEGKPSEIRKTTSTSTSTSTSTIFVAVSF